MTARFDRPAAGPTHDGRDRLIGLDVSRAVALIGVVVMNYRGMIGQEQDTVTGPSLLTRIFDIRTGVLSTRFAATFVVVAGIGVALLTKSARSSNDASQIFASRQRLLRRGIVLLVVGYFLDMFWPGTILFYYGVYFIIAAFIFRWSTRSLLVIVFGTIVATIGVSDWRRSRLLDGDPTSWTSPSRIESLQDFWARAFLGYTHPVLPWLVFLVIGMVIGRHMSAVRTRSHMISAWLIGATAGSYLGASIVRSLDVDRHSLVHVLTSMQPDERGLAYIVSTSCIAVLAFIGVSAVAERFHSAPMVVALQRAGQLSLTLYLGHVLFYYAIVEWFGWGVGTGLGAAISLALAYWVIAIVIGSWWHHRVGPGPAEWVYRRIGG